MILGLFALVLGLLLAHAILGRMVERGAGGLTGRGDPGLAIPAYALYVLLSIAAVVPSNWISRGMESQADREALLLTRDPETFIATEVRLAEENLSDVLPAAWIEIVLYTHPANARRVLRAERFR
jgi:STE24 endopeptidase